MNEREPKGLATAFERPDRLVYGQRPVDLPIGQINPFFEGQVRRVYDTDGISELADSIEANDLLHPLTVVELSLVDAVEYVADINELWRTDYSINDLVDNENGDYFILVAGHRRLKAIHNILDSQERDWLQASVQCNVRQGLGLTEALRLQYTENTHQQLEPSRDALAIKLYFNRRSREYEGIGRRFSYRQCSKELGVSANRVSDAEAYFTLPSETRKTVDAGIYSYSWVLRLAGLHNALLETRPSWSESDRADELNSILLNSRREAFTASTFNKYLDNRIDGLIYEQQVLVMSDEQMSPRSRADRAAESLVYRAVDDVNVALGHLALKHVSDFRTNPSIQRQVEDAQNIIDQLKA